MINPAFLWYHVGTLFDPYPCKNRSQTQRHMDSMTYVRRHLAPGGIGVCQVLRCQSLLRRQFPALPALRRHGAFHLALLSSMIQQGGTCRTGGVAKLRHFLRYCGELHAHRNHDLSHRMAQNQATTEANGNLPPNICQKMTTAQGSSMTSHPCHDSPGFFFRLDTIRTAILKLSPYRDARSFASLKHTEPGAPNKLYEFRWNMINHVIIKVLDDITEVKFLEHLEENAFASQPVRSTWVLFSVNPVRTWDAHQLVDHQHFIPCTLQFGEYPPFLDKVIYHPSS